jgi:hypothetical protein
MWGDFMEGAMCPRRIAPLLALVVACLPDPEPGAGNAEPGSCEAVVSCLWEKACGSDATCAADCTTGATTGAQVGLESLGKCLEEKCGSMSVAGGEIGSIAIKDLVCVYETCGAQARDCWPVGEASCAAIYACIMACPGQDDACWTGCMFSGAFTAQQKFYKLFTSCDACSDDFTQKCFATGCPLVAAACF